MKKKIGMLKSADLNEYELQNERASYKTIISKCVDDLVLCNNIVKIDDSIYNNMEGLEEDTEIYQFFLCNINECNKEYLLDCGFILSYSDLLDCDVLCVDHLGTAWDYVLTDVKLFDTYRELKEYEESKEVSECSN